MLGSKKSQLLLRKMKKLSYCKTLHCKKYTSHAKLKIVIPHRIFRIGIFQLSIKQTSLDLVRMLLKAFQILRLFNIQVLVFIS